jgi:hypothetical protein
VIYIIFGSMSPLLLIVLCWLVGAAVFYFSCKDRLPDGAWFQAAVNSLFWPAILIFIVVFRFYDPDGSKGGD